MMFIHTKRQILNIVFLFCATIIFSPRPALAVIADANIISQIRDLKASKIDRLSDDINNTQRQLRLTSRAHVLTKYERDQHPYKNSSHLENRHGQWVEVNPNKNPRKKPVVTFYSEDEKKAKIEELRSRLKLQKSNLDGIEANDLNDIIDSFRAPFSVNQFGRVGSAVVGIRAPVSGGYWGSMEIQQRMYVIGIINDHEVIVGYVFDYGEGNRSPDITKTFWLRGISTVGLVDRSPVKPPPFLIITGTHDYYNMGGEKQTVFMLEPLEIPPNW
jgi:hypothetical protein